MYLFTLSLHCDDKLYKANLAVGSVQQLRWISEFILSVAEVYCVWLLTVFAAFCGLVHPVGEMQLKLR